MSLSIVNDPVREASQQLFERFSSERVLERLRTVTPESDDDLVKLGACEVDWQAAQDADAIMAEAAAMKQGFQPRFVIWVGMHELIEAKGGPRAYLLNSTDPAKLKAILEDMQRTTGEQLPELLRATLAVGMDAEAETVWNLERMAGLYEKLGIASARNFATAPRGRGDLYPLALAGVDLKAWTAGAVLSDEEISTAFQLAGFLHAQGLNGRDKIALLLPRSWRSADIWTKRAFEESLGKSEALGIKIVIAEKVRLRSYRRVGDGLQDRAFLAVQRKGEAHPEAKQITELRHAKYPMAMLTFPAATPASHYMQFVHYTVAGLGYLRRMNFVTHPNSELYKAIARELCQEAKTAGGTGHLKAWMEMKRPDARKLGSDLKKQAASRAFEYGELTFFGDMRYNEEGRALRVTLERAADRIFRSRLKMPCDIYEGPAMNHAYHEMIIGHGKCFSILLIAAKQAHFAPAHSEPDYHMAEFLATKMALERRGRSVAAVPVDDLEGLDQYFSDVASFLSDGKV